MKASYNKQQFEPTTEKSFVSGPPLGKQNKMSFMNFQLSRFSGDDFFDRYTELIKRHQKKQKKRQSSFAGLLPADLIDRRKRKHQDPQVPAFYQIKAPVTLDYSSKPLEDFGFNPNGKWYGEKATGLLQPPAHNIKHRQVSLDFASPSSSSSFSPNNNWFGEKQTGFFSYPNHLVPKRHELHIFIPSLIPMTHLFRQMHDTSIIGFEMSDGIMTRYHLSFSSLQGLCRGEGPRQGGE